MERGTNCTGWEACYKVVPCVARCVTSCCQMSDQFLPNLEISTQTLGMGQFVDVQRFSFISWGFYNRLALNSPNICKFGPQVSQRTPIQSATTSQRLNKEKTNRAILRGSFIIAPSLQWRQLLCQRCHLQFTKYLKRRRIQRGINRNMSPLDRPPPLIPPHAFFSPDLLFLQYSSLLFRAELCPCLRSI